MRSDEAFKQSIIKSSTASISSKCEPIPLRRQQENVFESYHGVIRSQHLTLRKFDEQIDDKSHVAQSSDFSN